jgi:hypothetical protein
MDPCGRIEHGPVPTPLANGNSRTSRKRSPGAHDSASFVKERDNLGGTNDIYEAARELQLVCIRVCVFVYVSPGTHGAERCQILSSCRYITGSCQPPIMGPGSSLWSSERAILAFSHWVISHQSPTLPHLPVTSEGHSDGFLAYFNYTLSSCGLAAGCRTELGPSSESWLTDLMGCPAPTPPTSHSLTGPTHLADLEVEVVELNMPWQREGEALGQLSCGLTTSLRTCVDD